MSSQSVSAAEQIIADRAFIFIDYCSLFAEAALILHEYLITFDSEVRLMWRRKITGASIIFFLNRYIMLLSQLFILPTWAPVSDLTISRCRCAALGWLDVIFNLAPYFVWNVFATLRVYALTGRDWRIPSIVALLMLGPIAANIVLSCSAHIVVLVSRICLIAGDAVVIAVTWWKTYRLKREAEASNIKAPLVTMLLRDGTWRSDSSSTATYVNVGSLYFG
ncbi:hypothetical protein BD309DRAFT_865942 [Dichomitus squalens]|uniref:DUF6533 domain-containing protein n=1 Tax=Dichomitus squalens TaxID=114155 RepID=A0A4Q9PFF6_9APHY|nr:hypothetical protein BD309DRAFT_865942 [Dichomitus squalens]TBU52915.1 hypothetical protein BD310DRAFT_831252 [Dichomitus squalens]